MENNIQIIQQGYAEFANGNIEALLNLLHEDISWNDPCYPVIPHSGNRKGKDEVMNFFSEMSKNITFTQFEPRQFLSDGNFVTVKGFFSGKGNKSGKAFESDWIMMWEVIDGKIKSYQSFFDTNNMAAVIN